MAHRTQENTLLMFTGHQKCNSGTAKWENVQDREFDRRGMTFSCPPLWALPPPTPPHVGGFTSCLNLRVLQSSDFPRGHVSGTKISNSLITWSFWWPAPSWGCLEAWPLLISFRVNSGVIKGKKALSLRKFQKF